MKYRLLLAIPLLLLLAAMTAASLWFWLHPRARAMFRLPGQTLSDRTLYIRDGAIGIKHIYAYGEPLMEEDWETPGALQGARLRELPKSTWGLGQFELTIGQERRGDGGPLYRRHPRPADYWALTVPDWFISTTCPGLAVLLLLWLRKHFRRHLQRQRASRGLCPQCGYDLRGSSERCPECGATIPTVASQPQ